VHATHADGHELDLLSETGSRICVCPTTEANLGDGFLPVERLPHRGIRLCIGSDSNVRIDPLEELRELDGIARRQTGVATSSASRHCLRSGRRGCKPRSDSNSGRRSRSTSRTSSFGMWKSARCARRELLGRRRQVTRLRSRATRISSSLNARRALR